MVKFNYHADRQWNKPALYIELTRPNENQPFVKDLLAPVDTGAPLTAMPMEYKSIAKLHPHDTTPITHGNYHDSQCPLYLVSVTAEGCKTRLIDILFLPTLTNPVIGRNLMANWHILLDGPEEIIELSED